jgi:hypothetical protein
MSIWKHRRLIAMFVVDLLIAVVILSVNRVGAFMGATTGAYDSVTNAGERTEDAQLRLVFMLTTGFEDLREVELCLSDVKVAKASGDLSDVALILRGRGVDALTNLNGRPAQIAKLIREVKASGVHIIASKGDLKNDGLSGAALDPEPNELVPDGAVQMIEYMSRGYHVIRY